MGRRRAEREAEDVARKHRMSSLLSRALRVISWYRSYRQSKYDNLALAREMFVRRLQREGAAQWLTVGLWRSNQRLQAVAEKKVGVGPQLCTAQ